MRANDADLARATANGDEDAFCEIIRLYGGLIKAIVSYHLKDISMWRDDCVNDILFTVWQNIDRFDPDKNSLKNWLGAVAKYRAINYKRKYFKELYGRELTEDISDGKAVDENLMREEIRSEIMSLLDALPNADREIFIRRFIMEQPVERIATDNGKPASWIYNRLSRGRKILRKNANME